MKKLYILVFCLWCIHLTPLFAQNKNNLKRPNIVLILADDMGYSDIGCFGASTHTPVLDQMSASGLTMTHFYNASRCCPTRASLLTGLAQHQAGVGDMVNTRPEPAYQGYLNKQCVTIAEALKAGGYATYMAGKWHLGQAKENWPTRRGFDHYFGLIDGANSYFENRPYRPNQQLTIALEEQAYKFSLFIYAGGKDTPFVAKMFQKGRMDPNRPNLSRAEFDNTGWFPWLNSSFNAFTMNIDGNDVEIRGERGIQYSYIMSRYLNSDLGDVGYLSGI
jgi:arylsulfatase